MKHIAVAVDEELHKDLKRLCVERDTNISKLITDFVKQEVEKAKKEQTH